MTFNELGKNIYAASYLTGTFLLRSGTVSNEYFDKYRFESSPEILKAIAQHQAKLIPPGTELLAGLEMGGIPLAAALSLETGLPAVYVRKKPKEYGTCNFAEGADVAGKNVLIIEDVVTSGGQIVLSANDLRNIGAKITTALCVIDRQSGGTENLQKAGLELISLFTMDDLKQM